MKHLLLVLSLSLPLAATAQKLEATSPPVTYYTGSEKAPLYRSAADTASKTSFYLAPAEEVSMVGQYSPRWIVVKRQGFLYLTPSALVKAPASTKVATVPRTEEYCMILATAKFLSNKVTISIDFGQERRFFADNRYKDAEGRVQSFNSVIDVLNYQNGQGWEFVNAYAITVGQEKVYHYVMKRKVIQ